MKKHFNEGPGCLAPIRCRVLREAQPIAQVDTTNEN